MVARIWKAHVPSIRFLGKRSFQPQSITSQSNAKASSPSASTFRSSSSSISAAAIYYSSIRDIPHSFRRQALSQAEIDLIEGGGVPLSPSRHLPPKSK